MTLHIHFGAGRLGLGLVAPFFKSPDSELYLLNRAVSGEKPTGGTALRAGRRNELLRDNPDRSYAIQTPGGRETVHYDGFFTYDGEDLERTIPAVLAGSKQKSRGVVVTASVLQKTNYPSVLQGLNIICRAKGRDAGSIGDVFLVACENTVSAHEVFRDERLSDLISPESRRHVVPVHALVDRVCVGLEEDASGPHPLVRVSAEAYGSLKLQSSPESEPLAGMLHGSRVEFSRHLDTEKQIKAWLLNGTHWLIALRAYAAAEFDGDGADARELTLGQFLEASPENRDFARTVMDEMREGVAVLLRGDPRYADFVRDVDVDRYLAGAADKILERFEATSDPIKRILARFRAPSRDESRTIEAFNERFAGRVDGPMLAYESAHGFIPPASSRSIFSLQRLLASGAYVTGEQQ